MYISETASVHLGLSQVGDIPSFILPINNLILANFKKKFTRYLFYAFIFKQFHRPISKYVNMEINE